jgi:hypothetical protein
LAKHFYFDYPIKNKPRSDPLSDLCPSIWKRTMNVTKEHDVCIVNYWNNKTLFFSSTNILSDLDIITILGLDFSMGLYIFIIYFCWLQGLVIMFSVLELQMQKWIIYYIYKGIPSQCSYTFWFILVNNKLSLNIPKAL